MLVAQVLFLLPPLYLTYPERRGINDNIGHLCFSLCLLRLIFFLFFLSILHAVQLNLSLLLLFPAHFEIHNLFHLVSVHAEILADLVDI